MAKQRRRNPEGEEKKTLEYFSATLAIGSLIGTLASYSDQVATFWDQLDRLEGFNDTTEAATAASGATSYEAIQAAVTLSIIQFAAERFGSGEDLPYDLVDVVGVLPIAQIARYSREENPFVDVHPFRHATTDALQAASERMVHEAYPMACGWNPFTYGLTPLRRSLVRNVVSLNTYVRDAYDDIIRRVFEDDPESIVDHMGHDVAQYLMDLGVGALAIEQIRSGSPALPMLLSAFANYLSDEAVEAMYSQCGIGLEEANRVLQNIQEIVE